MRGRSSSPCTVQYCTYKCTALVSSLTICREEVEEFFTRMDRDFDGRLSFEEFMGEETTLEKLFKNMDKNNDGVVSKQVSELASRILCEYLF